MTVVLVLLTIITFLAADHLVQRFRAHRARELSFTRAAHFLPLSMGLPEELGIAPNHIWVRPEKGGILTIGFDEFLARMAGTVDEILLPKSGDRIAPALANLTLRDGERTLTLGSPVNGRIEEVNRELLRNPSLLRQDPYGGGWLVKIRSSKQDVRTMLARYGHEAIEWLFEQERLAKQFFVGQMGEAVPAMMQDGGALADGILKEYDAAVWSKFQHVFTMLPSTGDQKVSR